MSTRARPTPPSTYPWVSVLRASPWLPRSPPCSSRRVSCLALLLILLSRCGRCASEVTPMPTPRDGEVDAVSLACASWSGWLRAQWPRLALVVARLLLVAAAAFLFSKRSVLCVWEIACVGKSARFSAFLVCLNAGYTGVRRVRWFPFGIRQYRSKPNPIPIICPKHLPSSDIY